MMKHGFSLRLHVAGFRHRNPKPETNMTFTLKNKPLNKTRVIDFLGSPFFMALPIALFIIYFLPDIFQKYEVEQTHSGQADKNNSFEEYHDLDGDGYSERLVLFKNTLGFPAVKILNNDGSIVDQWNFTGRYPEQPGYFHCGDMDNDGAKEVYLFTVESDSLMLSAIAPFTEKEILFKNKLISRIWKHNDTVQVHISFGTFYDLDGDGFKEMIFAVKAGFSLQPRGIYVYSFVSDTIYHSKLYGANISGLFVEDIDMDGKADIFCSYSTLGNIHDSLGIPYSDYSSWLMGFNEKLDLMFTPIEYDAYPSHACMAKIRTGNKNRIVVFFKNKSKSGLPSMIAIIDEKGEIIRKKSIGKDGILNMHPTISAIIYKGIPAIMTKVDNNSIVLLDTLLQPVKTISNLATGRFLFKTDLNRDGNDELVFKVDNKNILITQIGFNYPVKIINDRDPFSKIPFCISIKKNGGNPPELFIKAENKVTFYTYNFNKRYYLKYPIRLGIYLIILSVILLIRHIQKIQLQQKMEIENRMNALQLKTIKSQMDPHFMFNVLNSISTSILNEQKENAYRYLVKFSGLLRSLFTNADELVVTLKEELAFVENYLELEKFRFKEKLSFEFEIDPKADQSIQLPRMLIQLFVENAIKHGLQHKEGKGRILIKAEQKNGQLIISIEDDGIGRKAAKQHQEGHGKGLKIIDEMIGLFEKLKGIHISYRYEDLFNENGQAVGTRVVIDVPEEPDLSGGAGIRSEA